MARPLDDFEEDAPPRRPRPDGRAASGGASGWKIFGIVAGITSLVLCCGVGGLVSLLYPAVSGARAAARTLESQNNVKQQALAVTNAATMSSGAFPSTRPAEGDDPAAPPVSWMTEILPFMDQRVLYRNIDFARPFDAPANAAVFGVAVRGYESPDAAADVRPGGLAPAHYAGNRPLFSGDWTFDAVGEADGVTNTLMIGEVNAADGAPAAWGDPDNLRTADAPLNGPTGFGANGAGGKIVVAFADGRAALLNPDVDPAVLAALGTPDGGEAIGPEDF